LTGEKLFRGTNLTFFHAGPKEAWTQFRLDLPEVPMPTKGKQILRILLGSAWQRCVVHFYRNVFTVVPKGKIKEVAAMLKAIHAQEDRQAAKIYEESKFLRDILRELTPLLKSRAGVRNRPSMVEAVMPPACSVVRDVIVVRQ
jgi:hypothetical protein